MAVAAATPLLADVTKKRLTELRAEIQRHERLYYVDDDPEIEDSEFDALMRELLDIEQHHPELVTPDSPSQRVGGEPREGVETAEHSSQLLSLDNAFNDGELRDFDRRAREPLGVEAIEYVGEYKFDGVSMAVRYAEGSMELALTRGDGHRGEVVTPNARTIPSLPLRLPADEIGRRALPAHFEVRGEVVMPKASFEKLNAQRRDKDETLFKNPRNAAAGALRMLDSKETAKRRLDFLAYMLLADGTDHFATQRESLEALESLGFRVDKHRKPLHGVNELLEFRDACLARRAELPYEIDGVVFKVNDRTQRRQLGSTSKAPRWAVACKPTAEQVETVVEDIDVQVGRTGAVTPRALLQPVEVGGVTVARATLHNQDEIARLGLQVGDHVLLVRSGDVIPKVVRVVKAGENRRPFEMPEKCPECGFELKRPDEEAVVRCASPDCPGRLRAAIEHFAHRSAMDIDGVGEVVVRQLVNRDLVKSIADLYALTVEELAGLETGIPMTRGDAARLIEDIEDRRENAEWWKVLKGLSILNVGGKTIDLLKDRYDSMGGLAAASAEDLSNIKGVSKKSAASIREYFGESRNLRLLRRFHERGVIALRGSPSGAWCAAEKADYGDTDQESADPEQVKKLTKAFWLAVRGDVSSAETKPKLAPRMIDDLCDAGVLRGPEDIFTLAADQVVGLGARLLGRKTAEKIVASIEDSKKAPLSALVFGLGIRHVGQRTAELLVENFGSMDRIRRASLEELAQVDEVGPEIAESIQKYFADENNRRLLADLESSGFDFQAVVEEEQRDVSLDGKAFVISGTLPDVSRDEAKKLIQRSGGKVIGSVSSKTNYLLAGEKAGSKLDKARKLGVPVIAWNQLQEMLGVSE